MTARISLKNSDMKRMATMARESGVVIEYVQGDITVRFLPAETPKEQSKEPSSLEEWKAARALIPPVPVLPPFDHREEKVMRHLAQLGKEIRVHWRSLNNFGDKTRQKLETRGFLAASWEPGQPEVLDEVWLTSLGEQAWKKLQDHYDKYPTF